MRELPILNTRACIATPLLGCAHQTRGVPHPPPRPCGRALGGACCQWGRTPDFGLQGLSNHPRRWNGAWVWRRNNDQEGCLPAFSHPEPWLWRAATAARHACQPYCRPTDLQPCSTPEVSVSGSYLQPQEVHGTKNGGIRTEGGQRHRGIHNLGVAAACKAGQTDKLCNFSAALSVVRHDVRGIQREAQLLLQAAAKLHSQGGRCYPCLLNGGTDGRVLVSPC